MSVDRATSASLLLPPEKRARELSIDVRGVSKSYRIPSQRIDTVRERFAHPMRSQEYRELRALEDVSFDVERGEFLGIVGRNGSGKSSLLKLLASIYRADRGTIRIAGRVAPFIELGVGFNHELTAFENVLLNGVMMGLTPREARGRFDAVMEFAELRGFEEMKLKNYSSGMLVRLGFSLMTQVDAEVFLVDEVLAVGDAAFQQRCFESFGRLHQEGRTIVLVTHDMVAVQAHCDRAILLEAGEIVESGPPADIARSYLELSFSKRQTTAEPEDTHWRGERGLIEFGTARVVSTRDETVTNLATGEPIRIEAEVEAVGTVERPVFAFTIANVDGHQVFATKPFGLDGREALRPGERARIGATIENMLTPGQYFVGCGVGRQGRGVETIAFRKNAADFIVYGQEEYTGLVALPYEAEATVEVER